MGTDHVDAQLGDELPAHALLGLPRATIAEACRDGGAVILIGPDPKEELGSLYLRLRDAATNGDVALIEMTPAATGLGDVAAAALHARPGEVGAVARALVSGEVAGAVGGVSTDAIAEVRDLIAGRPITVIIGRGSVAESADATLEAAAALSELDDVRFLPAVRRGNVMGALDMGMSPGLLPGRTTLDAGRSAFADVWPNLPATDGLDTPGILAAAADGDIDVLILLGADPVADALDAATAAEAIDRVGTVIAVDLFANASVARADIVLPAAAFTETSGSHTNLEGRITAIRQKVTPPGTARPDWMIAAELALVLGADLGIEDPDDIWAELAPRSAVHRDIDAGAIDAAPDGVVITATGRVAFAAPTTTVSIEPVDAYSLRLVARRKMYDQGTMVANASHMDGLAGAAQLRVNHYDFDRLGVDAGASVRVTSPAGSVDVAVVADDGVPRGVAVIDHNRAGADSRRLIVADAPSVDVRIAASGAS